jgi:hypothetical protein
MCHIFWCGRNFLTNFPAIAELWPFGLPVTHDSTDRAYIPCATSVDQCAHLCSLIMTCTVCFFDLQWSDIGYKPYSWNKCSWFLWVSNPSRSKNQLNTINWDILALLIIGLIGHPNEKAKIKHTKICHRWKLSPGIVRSWYKLWKDCIALSIVHLSEWAKGEK